MVEMLVKSCKTVVNEKQHHTVMWHYYKLYEKIKNPMQQRFKLKQRIRWYLIFNQNENAMNIRYF